MTQVERPRLNTELRWGQVYGVDLIDHESWMAGTPVIVPNDYVGQTRQKGRARENQHRDSQPFSDLIVGSPRVLWEGWCTDEQLDEMERHFIQDVPLEQRPRMNWLLNERNSRQIPKWVQKEQRHARDDRRGDPCWEPSPYRPETYGYRPPTATVRQWKPWQKQLVGWSAGWLTTTLTGWIFLVVRWDFGAWWHPPAISATAVTALIVWALCGFPLPKRQRRQRNRRRSR